MSLNKLRLLNEDQLLKAIKESGHDDIAEILTNKGLNGQLFLECEELQTISWRLSRVQMKNVFTFIKEVKANPAILVKSECAVRKPNPALPYSSKPSSVVERPKPNFAIPSKPSFPNINLKPLLTVKPQYNTAPAVTHQKVSSTGIESTREQSEFKKKLGFVLGNVGSASSTPSPNVNIKPPKYPPTPPKLENIQQVDYQRKPVKPLPTKPTEFPEIDDKPTINKPFLPEPPRAKAIRERLACPLPLPPKDVVEQSDSKPLDYGYLTPQDLNINYPSPARKTFLHNKFPGQSFDDDEKDPDELYESPPIAELKVSPIGCRKPLLLPKDDRGSQRSSLSNDAVPVEDVDEDDEENPNIYDHVDEPKPRYPGQQIKNHPLYPLQKKCTVNDLENILIVDKDKRTNNFFGSLGNIGKFIVDKCKSTKQETPNYENHILQTEISSFSTTAYSFKDRPLPDIPNIMETESATSGEISQLDMFRDTLINKFDRESSRNYVEEAKNDNDNDADDESDSIYENLKDKTRKVVAEPDLPEYENKISLNHSRSNTNNLLTKRTPLSDVLAYKLSAELKARDLSLQKSNFSKLSAPEPPEEEQLIYGNVDEIDQIEADEPIEEDMEEDQEDYIDSIFNINHEPFFRNIDRRGAKRLLANFTDGAFLFRPSEKYFLVLTIKFKGKFHNLGIERRPNNMIRLNADTQSVSPEFGTLRAFVNYFSKEPVSFKDSSDNLVEVYLNPVLPADVY